MGNFRILNYATTTDETCTYVTSTLYLIQTSAFCDNAIPKRPIDRKTLTLPVTWEMHYCSSEGPPLDLSRTHHWLTLLSRTTKVQLLLR